MTDPKVNSSTGPPFSVGTHEENEERILNNSEAGTAEVAADGCTDNVEVAEEATDEITAADDGRNPEGLSKNQLKKQRRLEYMKKRRLEKRKEEQERRKVRKREAAIAGNPFVSRKKLKNEGKMCNSSCKQRIVIDLSMDHLMIDKDIKKCYQQLQYCYSANRRAENPAQIYFTSFTGATRKQFDSIPGNSSWDVHMSDVDFTEKFGEEQKEKLVYLTAESDETLTELSDDDIYIIGGLVDHNAHKGHCHRVALEKGLRTAKLPLDTYINMETRKVLTINHVYEILLEKCQGTDWMSAITKILPQRKQFSAKTDPDAAQKPKAEMAVQIGDTIIRTDGTEEKAPVPPQSSALQPSKLSDQKPAESPLNLLSPADRLIASLEKNDEK